MITYGGRSLRLRENGVVIKQLYGEIVEVDGLGNYTIYEPGKEPERYEVDFENTEYFAQYIRVDAPTVQLTSVTPVPASLPVSSTPKKNIPRSSGSKTRRPKARNQRIQASNKRKSAKAAATSPKKKPPKAKPPTKASTKSHLSRLNSRKSTTRSISKSAPRLKATAPALPEYPSSSALSKKPSNKPSTTLIKLIPPPPRVRDLRSYHAKPIADDDDVIVIDDLDESDLSSDNLTELSDAEYQKLVKHYDSIEPKIEHTELVSLENADQQVSLDSEIITIDNGSDDDTTNNNDIWNRLLTSKPMDWSK